MRSLVICLVLAAAAPAGAAPLPDFARDSLGEWLVAAEDGRPGCRIVLGREAAKAGWTARPAAECAARLPPVARAASWTYEGGIRLHDAAGAMLLAFQEDESTIMKTSFETGPVHFIVRAKAGVERAPHAPSLVGAWMLRRPGGPVLCALALSKGPKDESTELTLATATPCDPAVARLRLNSARVEDFTLMLYGRPETSLRFEPAGPDAYAKSEAGRPLELVRAP